VEWRQLVEHADPDSDRQGFTRGVSCGGVDECVAVGFAAEGKRGRTGQTLVESWDGTAWSINPSPNPVGSVMNSLNGFSCPSPASCVATGFAFDGKKHQTLVETGPTPPSQSAGYRVSVATAGTPTSIKGQFTVPAITCTTTPRTEDATVDIEGTAGNAVAASVLGNCDNGVAAYVAMALDTPLTMTISPDDTAVPVATTDTQASPYGRIATVDDLTTGVSRSVRNDQGTESYGAFIGVAESDGTGESIPDFDNIQWVKAVFDNGSLGSVNPQGEVLTANPNHPKVLVGTSPLALSGESFRNVWEAGSSRNPNAPPTLSSGA
jgi:hypothetical protein